MPAYEQVDAIHCIRSGADNYEMLDIKRKAEGNTNLTCHVITIMPYG